MSFPNSTKCLNKTKRPVEGGSKYAAYFTFSNKSGSTSRMAYQNKTLNFKNREQSNNSMMEANQSQKICFEKPIELAHVKNERLTQKLIKISEYSKKKPILLNKSSEHRKTSVNKSCEHKFKKCTILKPKTKAKKIVKK